MITRISALRGERFFREVNLSSSASLTQNSPHLRIEIRTSASLTTELTIRLSPQLTDPFSSSRSRLRFRSGFPVHSQVSAPGASFSPHRKTSPVLALFLPVPFRNSRLLTSFVLLPLTLVS